MYTLYTNEIPLLYKLLNNKWYKTITGENIITFKNIQHLTVNFVDDSNSVISFNDQNQLKTYLESYYKLLHNFYNINKLKINPDKTNLLLIFKDKYKQSLKNFHFVAEKYKIYSKNTLKILGFYIQSDLKYDTEINKLVSTLHNRINTIRQVNSYTDFKTRLKFLNANVISKLNYMLPFYSSINNDQLNKLHKVIMTSARMAIGNYCFKVKCNKILGRCNWLPITEMISNAQCNFIHKIIMSKSPLKIFEMFIIPSRRVKEIRLYIQSKSKLSQHFLLFNSINLYNNLPDKLKQMPVNTFKMQLKKHLFKLVDT